MPLNVSAFLHTAKKNANKQKLTTRLFIPPHFDCMALALIEPLNVYMHTFSRSNYSQHIDYVDEQNKITYENIFVLF